MPSQREFIQAGLAASVAPVAFPIADSVSRSSPVDSVSASHHELYCVVCDVRSRWSADFAHAAECLGNRVVRTTGDITDFWFTDLSRRWREAPVAIAGLTAPGPLFCLERFGWDHGLRVVFRGTHQFCDGGQVEHALEGPFRTIAAAHVDVTRANWPRHLARLLNSCDVARDTATTTIRSAVTGDQRPDSDDTLVSWVIAPKHG
jgi:hypothetical protein